jgi:hypothetical protein
VQGNPINFQVANFFLGHKLILLCSDQIVGVWNIHLWTKKILVMLLRVCYNYILRPLVVVLFIDGHKIACYNLLGW